MRSGDRSASANRVLVTTVPFGSVDRRPLDLLESHALSYTINPLGRRVTEDELASMIGDFEVVIAGTEPITRRVMEAARRLRLISRVGIGLDNVDLVAARERGIDVSYTPDAPAPAVAELTIGLILALLRDVAGADRSLRTGTWRRSMGRRLSELTVGVIGVGRVGRRVIRHLIGGFPGVQILANDLVFEPTLDNCVRWVDKATIYREADVITLHLPLTVQTGRLIRSTEIDLMKPTALLINTSRGNMIDESDLAVALGSARIAGAAIDVFSREPYVGELASLEQCLLTCHMGSMSQDCRTRMEVEATEEAVRLCCGEPLRNLIPEVEYARAAQEAALIRDDVGAAFKT